MARSTGVTQRNPAPHMKPGSTKKQNDTQKTMVKKWNRGRGGENTMNTKKKKRQWINLRDKSQRWNHEKKLRDIRARALLKKQRRREEQQGDAENFNDNHGEGERSSKGDFRPRTFGATRDGAGFASDPDEFLERLLNPLHSKRKEENEEVIAVQRENAAVTDFGKESGGGRKKRRDAAAAHAAAGKTAAAAGESRARGGTDNATASTEEEEERDLRREKTGTTFSRKGKLCVEGQESAEEEGTEEEDNDERDEGSSYLGDREESVRSRKRDSRRIASYSPHSSGTFRDSSAFPSEKKRGQVREVSRTGGKKRRSETTQQTMKGSPSQGRSGLETPRPFSSCRAPKTFDEGSREARGGGERDSGTEGLKLEVSVDKHTKTHSDDPQTSLPKGIFYPFRAAMKEAARRKAAQEEERKRRQEEREKAEKEKELSRRRRAKQRRQLVARTSRGQPVMGNVVQLLLHKIRKSG